MRGSKPVRALRTLGTCMNHEPLNVLAVASTAREKGFAQTPSLVGVLVASLSMRRSIRRCFGKLAGFAERSQKPTWVGRLSETSKWFGVFVILGQIVIRRPALALGQFAVRIENGALGGTRTPDHLLRRQQLLIPTELRVRKMVERAACEAATSGVSNQRSNVTELPFHESGG